MYSACRMEDFVSVVVSFILSVFLLILHLCLMLALKVFTTILADEPF